MPIILSQSYEIVTEESAEHGEAAERGFDWQDTPHTFRETVDLIKSEGFTNPNSSHGIPRWITTDSEENFRTGEYTIKTLHPANDARSQRYWAKACKAAGVVK